jgi:hypothetical protein
VDVNTIVGALIGSGGILSVGGWIKYRDWKRKDKLAREDTSITRLEKENIAARARADSAEADEEKAKTERDRWRELAMLYKGRLIQAGLLNPDDTDDY